MKHAMSGRLMLHDCECLQLPMDKGKSAMMEYGNMGKERCRLACHRLLEFHMECMLDIVKEDSELMEAIYLLESAIDMVRDGGGLMVVEFHLRRVQGLGKEDGRMELHLGFVSDCVHVMHVNM